MKTKDAKDLFKSFSSWVSGISNSQKTLAIGISFIFVGIWLHSCSQTAKSEVNPKQDSLFRENSESSAQTEGNESIADTMIPKDHVLIPIEIANQESLSALMGQFAVVDLYANQAKSNRNSRMQGESKIASHVKLIRAPLNPQKFAVLIHQRSADPIVNYNEAFFAVVQSSLSDQQSKVERRGSPKSARPEISYQN